MSGLFSLHDFDELSPREDTASLVELRRLVQEGIDSGPGRFSHFEDIREEARRRFYESNDTITR